MCDRRWTVDSPLHAERASDNYFLDPAEQIQNKDLVDGEFLCITGAPVSGKTTQLLRIRHLLQEMGYYCFFFSFKRVFYPMNFDGFWSSVGKTLQRTSHLPFRVDITSPRTFHHVFAKQVWDRPIALLIDDLSKILRAPPECQDSFLRTLRESHHESAIRSIVVAGTFDLMHLNVSHPSLSLLNVTRVVQTPYFSIDETRYLFKMFQQDYRITIEDDVVDDIWTKSNGHPGTVCLSGWAILNNLRRLDDDGVRWLISFRNWERFAIEELHDEIGFFTLYLVKSLNEHTAQKAVQLYRSRFAGFFQDVSISNDDDEDLADFLTASGVLLRPDMHERKYTVASPLYDALVRLRVIPFHFGDAPSPYFPIPEIRPGVLDVPCALTESLKFFDKDLIRSAYHHSFKLSTVSVNGNGSCGARVPRQSVYNTELIRILRIWLCKWCPFSDWRLTTIGGKHMAIRRQYCDGYKPIVLQILATEDATSVKAHIEETAEYMALISVVEGWVIHFTCEDDFTPTWQTAEELECGVNVVHVSHKDDDFSNLTLHVYSKNTGLQKYDLCI